MGKTMFHLSLVFDLCLKSSGQWSVLPLREAQGRVTLPAGGALFAAGFACPRGTGAQRHFSELHSNSCCDAVFKNRCKLLTLL